MVTLSAVFDTDEYRLRPKEKPSYVAVTAGRAECDECGARQHETRGMSGVRQRVAVIRKVFTDGPSLRLCRAHAELWRDRDAIDLGTSRPRRSYA